MVGERGAGLLVADLLADRVAATMAAGAAEGRIGGCLRGRERELVCLKASSNAWMQKRGVVVGACFPRGPIRGTE